MSGIYFSESRYISRGSPYLGSDTKAGLPVQDPTNSADTLVLQMKGKYGENYMAPPPPKSLLLISLYAACTRSRSLSRLHSHGRLPIP